MCDVWVHQDKVRERSPKVAAQEITFLMEISVVNGCMLCPTPLFLAGATKGKKHVRYESTRQKGPQRKSVGYLRRDALACPVVSRAHFGLPWHTSICAHACEYHYMHAIHIPSAFWEFSRVRTCICVLLMSGNHACAPVYACFGCRAPPCVRTCVYACNVRVGYIRTCTRV